MSGLENESWSPTNLDLGGTKVVRVVTFFLHRICGFLRAFARTCLLRSICFSAVTGLSFLIVVFGASAQDKKTLAPGSSSIIAESGKPLKTFGGAITGTVKIAESADTPKTYYLIYYAPKSSSDLTETINYLEDRTERTVQISVTTRTEPPTLTSADIYQQSFKALFVLFVLATILEFGLAVIFNWRPFVVNFDSRGVKTVIMVGFSLFFVWSFDLDVITRLINVYSGTDHPVNFPGLLVTAFVVAGGSSGVNNLLLALGFRSVKTAEQISPKPPKTEAWLSVRLTREKAVGPVTVLIGSPGEPLSVAGTITGVSRASGLLKYFVRDFGRFPTAGGYSIVPNAQPYLVRVEGFDHDGNAIRSADWGPYPIALRAIVDNELSL